jgi:hypothetical protein
MTKLYEIHFNFDRGCSKVKTGGIKLETKGQFLLTTDSWSTPINEIIKEEKINFINVSKDDLRDKSIYRTPKLKLPRNKVDLLKEECNLKVTRNKDKADYIITSENFITDSIANTWTRCITKDDLNNLLNDVRFSVLFTDQAFLHLKNILPQEGVFQINANGSWGDNLSFKSASDLTALYRDLTPGKNKYTWYIKENLVNDYKAIASTTNLIKDTRIVELCNSNLHVMTEEEFKSFNTIFEESTSDDDKAMALEMMANCNLDKCMDKVAFLYYMNFNVIRYCKNWNHINVKALRKVLPVPSNNHEYTHYYEKLIKFLIDEKQLTEFIVKNILVKIVSLGLNRFGFGQGMFELDPEDIKIADKYKSAIIKNESGANIIDNILAGDILRGSDDLLF